jgi:hypothetical protein
MREQRPFLLLAALVATLQVLPSSTADTGHGGPDVRRNTVAGRRAFDYGTWDEKWRKEKTLCQKACGVFCADLNVSITRSACSCVKRCETKAFKFVTPTTSTRHEGKGKT